MKPSWNILLGVTKSIAERLTPKLSLELSTKLGSCRVITTSESQSLSDYYRSRVINHTTNRQTSSAFVVAPLTANTLAKFVNGLCDNEVTDTFRAWDFETKPVIVAPAMNTFMWRNPITVRQVRELRDMGVRIIDPQWKALPCGDEGQGAMAEIDEIVRELTRSLRWASPLCDDFAIPRTIDPGSFGFQRRSYRHTGVDLYCHKNAIVCAVETGRVVHTGQFTGPGVDTKWLETWGLAVEGPTGVVVYGELQKNQWRVGDIIRRDQSIGFVAPVLTETQVRPDIPGHSRYMLHLELWKHGTKGFNDWAGNEESIIDPSPYLRETAKCIGG